MVIGLREALLKVNVQIRHLNEIALIYNDHLDDKDEWKRAKLRKKLRRLERKWYLFHD